MTSLLDIKSINPHDAPEITHLRIMRKRPALMTLAGTALTFSFLAAPSLSSVQAQEVPSIEADELRMDQASGATTAQGNVIVQFDNTSLRADQLIWANDEIDAKGDVSVDRGDGLSVTADQATLDGTLKKGRLQSAQVNLPNDATLRADTVDYHAGAQTTLNDASYTACRRCETGDPQWQVRSSEAVHDETTETISSWHNRIELGGVPVLYIPYLAHPSPNVRKRSGFLAPELGNDGRLGAYITTPYFFNLAPNYDLTVKPQMTRDEGLVLETDWRHLTNHGRYELALYGNAPQDELSTIDGDHAFRGGIMGKGAFSAGTTELNFVIEEPTDDLFFDRYRISDATSFNNKLNLSKGYSGGAGEGTVRVDVSQYRYINDTVSDSRVHDIAPYLQHLHRFDGAVWGGQVQLKNTVKHTRRDFGLNLTELSSQVLWSKKHIASNGTVWTMTNQSEVNHFDYQVAADQTRPGTAENDTFVSNVTAINAEYPLIRFGPTATQRLAPRMQVVGVASDRNLQAQYLRSDVARDLSATDLFQINAAGSELSRANLGLVYSLAHRSGVTVEFFIGQSYNLASETYAEATGYGEDESNLVTETQISYRGLLLNNTLRIDQSSGDILRHRTSLRFDAAPIAVQAQYNFYEQGQIGAEREELNIEGELKLASNWFVRGKRLENLETNEIVREFAGLSYRDECTDIELRYTKDNTQIGALPPSSSIMLFINLKTLGGVSRDR